MICVSFLHYSVTVLPFAVDKNLIEWSFEIMQILCFIIVVLVSIILVCCAYLYDFCLMTVIFVPFFCLFVFFLDKFHYVVQAALVLMILLPLSLECWDCSWESPAHFFLYLSFVFNCDHWEILLAIFCFLLTCPPHTFLIISLWHHKTFQALLPFLFFQNCNQ